MSDQTFEALFKRLLVHAPDLSWPLAQEFVNTAYSRALALHDWSALRSRQDVFTPAVYSTGTIAMVQGSTTVTGSGTAWTSDMEGRQIYVDGQPYFTILQVVGPTQVTVDRAWAQANEAGLSYEIGLYIFTAPSDFLHFISFTDPANNWRLHTDFLSEDVDRWDAERSSAGTPFLVLNQGVTGSGYATIAAGLRRFELYPRPTGEHLYSYTYYRKPALLSAYSDRPIWPLRGDALRAGAIAELCKWPGTKQTPNPHFDLNLYALYEQDFQREIGRCAREDQEVAATNIRYDDPFHGMLFAPLSASFLQAHDIVVGG